MRFLIFVASSLLCVSSRAAVLTDASTFISPSIVDDWSGIANAHGEDGPIVYQGLTIESLENSPMYQEFNHYIASPNTGFPDDADGIVSALNASTTDTDFLFTFPEVVLRAGLYMRGRGTFRVEALDSSRNVLESTTVVLGESVFRGFSDLSDLRSIRVDQLLPGRYSTQFDEVQWQPIPEPPSGLLMLLAASLLRHGYRQI